MPVLFNCDYCGRSVKAPPSQYARSEHHFCSPVCRNRYNNPDKNKRLMTDAVRSKLRAGRLGTGGGRSYEKTYGRHTHRIVAEQILGRPLRKGEVVHHLDGDKRNNAPENLMIFSSQREHAAWHAAHNKKEVTSHGVCPEKAPANRCGVPV